MAIILGKECIVKALDAIGVELIAQGYNEIASQLCEISNAIPDDVVSYHDEPAHGKQFDAIKRANEVLQERSTVDGRHEDSFEYIANLWTEYITIVLPQNEGVLTKKDVAFMMILLKIARELETKHPDNLIDMIGYAALAYEM